MLDMIVSQIANGLVLGGPLRADRDRAVDHLRAARHRELRAWRVLRARRLFRADAVPRLRLAGRGAGADQRRRHRHGGRAGADPPALRQGAADQPDRHLRAGAADRGADPADLGRQRPAVQRAALPRRLPPLGPDADHQVPAGGAGRSTVALLVALWAFLHYTPFGRILRAGSRATPRWSGLLGINLPLRADLGVRPRLRAGRHRRAAGGAAVDRHARRCRRARSCRPSSW